MTQEIFDEQAPLHIFDKQKFNIPPAIIYIEFALFMFFYAAVMIANGCWLIETSIAKQPQPESQFSVFKIDKIPGIKETDFINDFFSIESSGGTGPKHFFSLIDFWRIDGKIFIIPTGPKAKIFHARRIYQISSVIIYNFCGYAANILILIFLENIDGFLQPILVQDSVIVDQSDILSLGLLKPDIVGLGIAIIPFQSNKFIKIIIFFDYL